MATLPVCKRDVQFDAKLINN